MPNGPPNQLGDRHARASFHRIKTVRELQIDHERLTIPYHAIAMMEISVAHALSMNLLNQSNYLVPHHGEVLCPCRASPLVEGKASLQATASFVHMNHFGRQSIFSKAWKKREMTSAVVVASEWSEDAVFAHIAIVWARGQALDVRKQAAARSGCPSKVRAGRSPLERQRNTL